MTNPQPIPPAIYSGQELYDGIMGVVDPELTSAQMPLLHEKYVHETPEQRAARAARYEAAFAEYERRLQLYGDEWEGAFRTYKKAALASLEAQHADGEQDALSSLESSIASL